MTSDPAEDASDGSKQPQISPAMGDPPAPSAPAGKPTALGASTTAVRSDGGGGADGRAGVDGVVTAGGSEDSPPQHENEKEDGLGAPRPRAKDGDSPSVLSAVAVGAAGGVDTPRTAVGDGNDGGDHAGARERRPPSAGGAGEGPAVGAATAVASAGGGCAGAAVVERADATAAEGCKSDGGVASPPAPAREAVSGEDGAAAGRSPSSTEVEEHAGEFVVSVWNLLLRFAFIRGFAGPPRVLPGGCSTFLCAVAERNDGRRR